jgi:hypothetical protein
MLHMDGQSPSGFLASTYTGMDATSWPATEPSEDQDPDDSEDTDPAEQSHEANNTPFEFGAYPEGLVLKDIAQSKIAIEADNLAGLIAESQSWDQFWHSLAKDPGVLVRGYILEATTYSDLMLQVFSPG